LNDSALSRFFGVVALPRTWLGIAFHVLAFPLGLFYFVFLVVGISVGVGLVVIWVGIPILLVVAGAWWLFAAFERVQARSLLGAAVPPAPRPWETADGVWGKLKAHFGSGSTWRDLAYLFAKLPLGIVSFLLLVALASAVGSLFAMPVFAAYDVPVVNGTWVPPLWFGILCVPVGAFVLIVALHLMNAWGWVCARWAEILFRAPGVTGYAAAAPRAADAAPPDPFAPPAPLDPTQPDARLAPRAAPAPPAPPEPPAPAPEASSETVTSAPPREAIAETTAPVPPPEDPPN